MNIDWEKEVALRKEAMMKDLFELLKINSERDDDAATPDAPFGPGPKEALLKMLSYGERDGFQTKNVDNYAGHIDLGEGAETLGMFGHMDVVPAGSGWKTDPYQPVIKDGKLYARGSSDDKGPAIAAYYAMKIIKDLKLPLSKKIRFVIGTDEESGWGDMEHYFKTEKAPDFGFSPDAEFPIINGEKGNVSAFLRFSGTNGGAYSLVSFAAGLRENMVPESAKAVVKAPSEDAAKELVKEFDHYLAENKLTGTTDINGNTVTMELKGKAAHGASPQLGINGGTYLAHFLMTKDFGEGAKDFLELAGDLFHDDYRAEKSGAAFKDPKMGELTMNVGILRFGSGSSDNELVLNFRYPQGTTSDKIIDHLQKAVGSRSKVSKGERDMPPHYVPQDDPLVKTLLDVYEKHTGQKGYEQIIGGGTYGRLLKRGVAYGAQFPGYEDTMHQANEYMKVDDILKSAAIYGDALYQLAK